MNTPDDAGDDTIHRMLGDEETAKLAERGFIPPKHPDKRMTSDSNEHPLSTYLYRRFKAGSAILTKDEAWSIANELDRLYQVERDLLGRLDELTTELANMAGTALGLADLDGVSRQIKAGIESLSRKPT